MTALADPIAPPTNDPAAHALLREAHDAGYRFPEGFPGFAAAFTLAHAGGTLTGQVTVRAPRDIEVTAEGDDALLAWVRQELGSMAGHRWPAPYEAGDGRWTQTLGPEDGDPLGRLVLTHDDPFGSSYRVRDGRIAGVNRRMGGTRFSIAIQAHAELPDGRLLPSAFTVSYWDAASGRLTRADAYADRYLEVDGVSLPAARRVVTAADNGLTARELSLTGHELLPGAATGGPAEAERAGTRAG